mgnify:CR=1 FL=1
MEHGEAFQPDLVLLDNRFATLPVVVEQGRKVINNVERVSNLFVSKAAYAVLLTLAVGILGSPFPFLPRQLTLIGTFSIGIPPSFLAPAPETNPVRPGSPRRVRRPPPPARPPRRCCAPSHCHCNHVGHHSLRFIHNLRDF